MTTLILVVLNFSHHQTTNANVLLNLATTGQLDEELPLRLSVSNAPRSRERVWSQCQGEYDIPRWLRDNMEELP